MQSTLFTSLRPGLIPVLVIVGIISGAMISPEAGFFAAPQIGGVVYKSLK